MQSLDDSRPISEARPKVRKGEVLLRTEKVVKGFPGVWEHLILDAVDFDVKSGEVHVILGENGAGKTVLANILSGFAGRYTSERNLSQSIHQRMR